jgi:hypothetical protein
MVKEIRISIDKYLLGRFWNTLDVISADKASLSKVSKAAIERSHLSQGFNVIGCAWLPMNSRKGHSLNFCDICP